MAATVTRTELQALIADGAAVVVETLGPMYYAEGHLPGAVNIPHTEVEALAPRLLPDRAATVVTYCSNTRCANSAEAQARLIAMGYRDVRKYAEGKQDWQEAGLPLETGVPVHG